MSIFIKPPSAFYPLQKAREIADELQSLEDDGWRYEVVDCKNGFGRVDVYDDEDFLIHEGFYVG